MAQPAPDEALRAALVPLTRPAGAAVRSITVEHSAARIVIELPKGSNAAAAEAVRAAVVACAQSVDGIEDVEAIVTAEAAPAPNPGPKPPPQRGGPIRLPGVTDIIAVASGKGGVGKSTVAVNLALGLARLGKRVGLLDADIYGPSIPRMLNLTDAPDGDGVKKLNPADAYGLKVMSIGLLVDTEKPMIWRGPMVSSAIGQLLGDVDWGELDVLVVDMPPGTGDAQLTMAQRVALSGAVIVSTPQEIALIDARKGLAMFERTHVPVLGIVENMAWFGLPDGNRSYIFGEGGARRTAEMLGAPFLGEIPIYPEIGAGSDAGAPIVAAQPDAAATRPFLTLAEAVAERLGTLKRTPPRIVML